MQWLRLINHVNHFHIICMQHSKTESRMNRSGAAAFSAHKIWADGEVSGMVNIHLLQYKQGSYLATSGYENTSCQTNNELTSEVTEYSISGCFYSTLHNTA